MGSPAAKKFDHPAQRIKKRRKPQRRRGRVFDGEDPAHQLVNADPDVFYSWVRRGSALQGVGNEEYFCGVLGYEVIVASDDPSAVRTKTGKVVPGQPFIKQDLILVGIHREDKELLEQEGLDGMGGQVRAREIDKLLGKGRSGGEDSDAGFSNPGVFQDAEDAASASSRLLRTREAIHPNQ